MSESSFCYELLSDPTTQIRILVIEKADYDAPLRAALNVRGSCASCIYDAISYCWGEPDFSGEIYLKSGNDTVLQPISKNLEMALRRLRSASEDVRLWNDAICINQLNINEKSCQVLLMAQVYEKARKVLIYLGEASDDSSEARQMLEQLEQAFLTTSQTDTRSVIQWITYHGLPHVNESRRWEPLKNFFRRPWFRRKWIIQEFVVAVNPVFFCGEWTISWASMQAIAGAIRRCGLGVWDHTSYTNINSANELQQGLSQLREMLNLKIAWNRKAKFSLMHVAYRSQLSRATDLRDHLFALLGLVNDRQADELKPRYTPENTICKNCVRYARFFLHAQENLEVLYRAGIHDQRLLAPSWVPNWYGGHESASAEYAEGLWDPHRRPSFLNIAGGSMARIFDSGSPDILGIMGFRIDTIEKLANTRLLNVDSGQQRDLEFYIQQKRLHLKEADDIMQTLGTYLVDEDLETVKWRTLICNVTADLKRAPPEYLESYRVWRHVLESNDPRTVTAQHRANREPVRRVVDNFNHDKVFGSTEHGYVGMFPWKSCCGYSIYVLSGGEFPFVLRETEDQNVHQLVGQCYVHGRMERDELRLNEYEPEEIMLGGPYDIAAQDKVEPSN